MVIGGSNELSCQGTLCEFQRWDKLEVKIPDTLKRGFHHKCPDRVVFISKNKDGVWKVSEVCPIFDHHVDCTVFTTRPRVTTLQIRNLPVAQSLVRNHPDIRTPSFVSKIMDTVGTSCHQSKRTILPDFGYHETTEVLDRPLTITRVRLPLFPYPLLSICQKKTRFF